MRKKKSLRPFKDKKYVVILGPLWAKTSPYDHVMGHIYTKLDLIYIPKIMVANIIIIII